MLLARNSGDDLSREVGALQMGAKENLDDRTQKGDGCRLQAGREKLTPTADVPHDPSLSVRLSGELRS